MGLFIIYSISDKNGTMTGAVSAMTVSMNLSGISVSIAEMLMFPILLLICIIFMIKIFKEIKV